MSDAYTLLARASFETFVREGTRFTYSEDALAQSAPELLNTQAGCFVSLHMGDALRGCIGTLGPTQARLADEIVENAISACSRDPRFPAVRPEELAEIHCSVDVLGEPEHITGPEELNVKRYGVIVSNGFRRGVLLPDLDGVDTVEQQIAIAKQKARIDLSESCNLQRFEVTRHLE